MKKSMFTLLIAFLLCSTIKANGWIMIPDDNASFGGSSATSVTFTTLVDANSYVDLQVFIKSTFGIQPNKKYNLSFNAVSSVPCSIWLRFGEEHYKNIGWQNYFLDKTKNISTSPQKFDGLKVVTSDFLIPDLQFYIQGNGIPKGTTVSITNITLEEEIAPEPLPMETDVDTLVYDMMGFPTRTDAKAIAYDWLNWGKHEGELDVDIPNNDWKEGARPKEWMANENYHAISAWGQIIEDKYGSPEKNVRFQIRNHIMYLHYDNAWHIAENMIDDFEAARFNTDYTKYESGTYLPFNTVSNNNGGGIAIAAQPNGILHWWKKVADNPRSTLPQNCDAIFIRCEMRLVQNENGNVNLNNAKYYGGVSADYYYQINDSAREHNQGIAQARQKRITPNWRVFTAFIVGNTAPKTATEYRNNIQALNSLPPYVTNISTRSNNRMHSDLVVSPNPSSNYLQVKNGIGVAHINIYDLNGRNILAQNISGDGAVSISTLPRGIYVVEVISQEGIFRQKIIKK